MSLNNYNALILMIYNNVICIIHITHTANMRSAVCLIKYSPDAASASCFVGILTKAFEVKFKFIKLTVNMVILNDLDILGSCSLITGYLAPSRVE